MPYYLDNAFLLDNPWITVVGCGGTGGFVAEGLCRLFQGREATIVLVDHDRVESHNLLRQNFYAEDVGRFKSQALADRLARAYRRPVGYSAYPFREEESRPHGHRYPGLPPYGDCLIIGCADNAAARRAMAESLPGDPCRWLIDAGNDTNWGQVLVGNVAEPVTLHEPPFTGETCHLAPAPTLQRPDLLTAVSTRPPDVDCAAALDLTDQELEEALDLIEKKEGRRPDLSRIDPEDPGVYDMINQGRSKGVFLLQSPAQLKMGQRLKSRSLLDLAYQVALIRPGVGVQGSSVSQFVERYRHGATWEYDHPLEQRALERGYGIIVWQEQVVQLIMDVAGFTAAQADELRRAFARSHSDHLVAMHRERFLEGSQSKGVTEEAARKIFAKINGHYMFPESHSHAFAVTAYQAAWLKRYHPLEFFLTLMNNQPMGFYPWETLKEDAKRFGVTFLNPCVNRSKVRCVPEQGCVLLGLQLIKDVGERAGRLIVEERDRHGAYTNAGDLVRRTGLKPQAVQSLVMAGDFDSITANRRIALWDAGLPIRPSRNVQRAFPVSGQESVPNLADLTEYERMVGEYRVMGIYPRGHVMEFVRPTLSADVLPALAVEGLGDGDKVLVAGWPVARQHPRGQDGTVFVTIEDETGDVQLILWPKVFARCRRALGNQVILARGRVSRWDGTTNVVVSEMERIGAKVAMPTAHDWH